MENNNEEKSNISDSLLSAFDQLKTTIFGEDDPEIKVLDSDIADTISTLSYIINDKDAFNYAESLKNIITSSLDSSSFENNSANSFTTHPDTARRFSRYVNASEIENSITYCARALKVLCDSITSPDNVTDKSFSFSIASNNDDSLEKHVSNLEDITDNLLLDDEIYNIVYQTLKYGDLFIEICDYKSHEVPLTQSLYLTETLKGNTIKEKKKILKESSQEFSIDTIKIQTENKTFKDLYKTESFDPGDNITNAYLEQEDKTLKEITIELIEDVNQDTLDELNLIRESIFNKKLSASQKILNEGGELADYMKDSDKQEENESDKVNKINDKIKDKETDTHDLQDVRVIIHDPRRIIKIQSDKYKINLGYLILPIKSDKKTNNFLSNNSNSNHSTSQYTGGGFNINTFDSAQGVDKVYDDIVKIIKKYVNSNSLAIDSEETKELLKRAIKEMEIDSNNLKIRYVSPEKMEHFALNSSNNFPYGEGIFEKVLFQAKQYIILKTALTIKRVSDATEKRIISVDTTTPRNARNLVESIKEKLRKSKYSIDTFGNIGSISSIITNFDAYIIPMNKDRSYVKFDTLPPASDLKSMSEDLKTYRDEIIGGLDVPPSYVNIEENLSACVSRTYIELSNGKNIQLKELIERFENGEEFEVLSYDEKLGVVFPNKVKWAGYTQYNVPVYKVTLDNNESIYVTKGHKLMRRDGTYDPVENIKVGDSLMPYYVKPTNYAKNRHGNHVQYDKVFHPGVNIWDWAHTSYARYWNLVQEKEHVHHIDMNPRNNSTNNLIGLTPEQHCSIHSRTRDFTYEDLLELQTNRKALMELAQPGLTYQSMNCKVCNKEFKKTISLNKVTCSNECLKEYRKVTGMMSWESRKEKSDYKTINKNCFFCNNEIKYTPSDPYIKSLAQKPYLVPSCENLVCAEKARGMNLSLSKSNGKRFSNIEVRNCEICNSDFVFSDSKSQEEKKFQTVCYETKCINTKLARTHSCKRKNGKTFNCMICDKEFYRPLSYLKNIKNEATLTCGDKDCFKQSMAIINKAKVKEEEPILLNHKVIKIELLTEGVDCGDISVDHYHNFAIGSGVFIHNSNKCLTFDTEINLTNGSIVLLKDLIDEYETTGSISNKWTYSYNKETGKIVPGEIGWAGRTRLNAELVEVLLDNDTVITTTPDHKFMLRNGEWCEAKDLKENDSLMPLYVKNANNTNNKKEPYTKVYHPGINKWEYTHRSFAISNGLVKEGDSNTVIHHVDFNPRNNDPINFKPLSRKEHIELHRSMGHIESKSLYGTFVKMECPMCNVIFDKHYNSKQSTCLSEECKFKLKSINSKKMMDKRYEGRSVTLKCPYCSIEFKRKKSYVDNIKYNNITCGSKECFKQSFVDLSKLDERKEVCSKGGKKGSIKLVEYIKENGAYLKDKTKETHPEHYKKRHETLLKNKDKILNHKVVSVTFLTETQDTGCINVKEYHNFAVHNSVIVSNSSLAHESYMFAETINSYQRFFERHLFSLFSKIYRFSYKEKLSKDIRVQFPPPKFLRIEREADAAEASIRLINSYQSQGIPVEYLKSKFLPMNWKEIDEFKIKEQLEKRDEPAQIIPPDGQMNNTGGFN